MQQNFYILRQGNWNTFQPWEIAKLKNLSLIASMTNDIDWQHELCSRIEKIEG
ncbi:hypothetical protein BRLA_c030770 [Brevibacillus laterosporus LMG 15441]|uniref:Uncharacterized protein n=1 Tax=Brevibacillus laterosporus LMG 15441 TaxID=1042163 RepID=A0A075R6E3_BRELA|nr:hypothetical protein BRLA_c030770 [Brevibacillus laterosporus LMG 15441]